jgi:hypothetical protein
MGESIAGIIPAVRVSIGGMNVAQKHHPTAIGMNTALNFLIASKRCEIAGLRQLAETSGLVKAIGHFVHALQRERGLSNLYLGSSGLQGDTERLTQIEQSQIWQTQVLVCFDALERDAAVPNGQGLRLLARIAYVLQGLEALPGLRERVRTQAWRAAQATAAYTQLIQALLSVVFEAADPALDPAISRQLVALFNLMQGKEFAGQERAIGSALFASGQADRASQQRLLRLIESQEQCLRLFLDFASPEQQAAWQATLVNSSDALLERLRRVLCTAATHSALDVPQSQPWYDVCTARMDAMKSVEDRVSADLLALCAHQLDAARSALHTLEAVPTFNVDRSALAFFDEALATVDTPIEPDVHPASSYGAHVDRTILEIVHEQAQRLQAMSDELDTVRASLHERKLVERAKGLLMAHHQLSEDEAHKALRNMAMNQNRRLMEVAEAVLTTAAVLPRSPRR